MAKPVYVLTFALNGASVLLPEIFDSLDGAKEYIEKNWGVKLQRMSQSYWQGVTDDFTVRLHKRTVFKK